MSGVGQRHLQGNFFPFGLVEFPQSMGDEINHQVCFPPGDHAQGIEVRKPHPGAVITPEPVPAKIHKENLVAQRDHMFGLPGTVGPPLCFFSRGAKRYAQHGHQNDRIYEKFEFHGNLHYTAATNVRIPDVQSVSRSEKLNYLSYMVKLIINRPGGHLGSLQSSLVMDIRRDLNTIPQRRDQNVPRGHKILV